MAEMVEAMHADARAEVAATLQSSDWEQLRDQLIELRDRLSEAQFDKAWKFIWAIDLLRSELITWATTA
jgi:hypothetical protein